MKMAAPSVRSAVTLVILAFAVMAVGQGDKTLSAHTFKCESLAFVYTWPEGMTPQPEDQLPKDPTGREHILLALWDSPRSTSVPRIVVLHDSKVRQPNLSADAIAEGYLHSLKPVAVSTLSKPIEIFYDGFAVWLMDYSAAGNSDQSHNAAIAIALKDRTVLFVQMNASSQNRLETLVRSLQELHFTSK